MAEAVKVIVRCRPLNDRENNLKSAMVLDMDCSIMQVQLKKPKTTEGPPKQFTFDGVYYIDNSTLQIYDDICFSLVNGVLDGYNGTVFAYGQTGCGKSYTMMGVEDPPENRGVIPRAFGHIFDHVAVNSSVKFLVRASYLEIYNEEVRDLLAKDSKKKLDLKEHPEKGVYVKDLSTHKVHNVKDLEKVMALGSSNRSVGATLMNVDSSRSHSIFTIDIEMMEEIKGQSKLKAGRLNLVDLAGSERQSKTGSTGERLKEATKINLSLSALGNVISALVDGKSKHIPYRDSKLTRLLQSSLGGNTKTLMVACVSPADNNYEETLSTLRYANRAKNIKNKPKINEDPKDALLREYQEEIKKLKMMLEGKDMSSIVGPTSTQAMPPPAAFGPSSDQLKRWEEEKEAIKREYEEQILELKDKFGKEKANKAELEEELSKIQDAKNKQLSSLDEEQQQQQQQLQQQHSDAKGDYSAEAQPIKPAEKNRKLGKKDREIMKNKEEVLKRLEQLQGEMIGGERANDQKLKKTMERRRKVAEDRHQRRLKLGLENEDDFIIEDIFNSLTDEVRVKTKALERCREKMLVAEEEVKDLSHEFEEEREDYLDTIRRQDQTIMLYDQLLSTVVPLIRRDCNYFNMDKIKDDCKFDKEAGHWILPKVTTSRTVLTLTGSPTSSAGGSHKMLSSVVTSPSDGGGSDTNIQKGISSSSGKGFGGVEMNGDKYLTYLQKTDNSSEYFKPKRAKELLGQTRPLTKEASPSHIHGISTTKSVSSQESFSSMPNAAAVHGVDASSVSNMRPGKKLQSLAKNPVIPQTFGSSQETKNLGKMDKSKKKHALEPLSDTKLKKSSK